jgi:hypothetical protein
LGSFASEGDGGGGDVVAPVANTGEGGGGGCGGGRRGRLDLLARVGMREGRLGGQTHQRLAFKHYGGVEGAEGLHLGFGCEEGQFIPKEYEKSVKRRERKKGRGAPDTAPFFHPIWPSPLYPSLPLPFQLAFAASPFEILLDASRGWRGCEVRDIEWRVVSSGSMASKSGPEKQIQVSRTYKGPEMAKKDALRVEQAPMVPLGLRLLDVLALHGRHGLREIKR